ncbi:MAG: hypothetical protein CM15mP120_06410 [Pseudomonadota bacterium]|nr:MAG: hypothetical protein CM15mP120_06410 [Pseudomonadota bacterium]
MFWWSVFRGRTLGEDHFARGAAQATFLLADRVIVLAYGLCGSDEAGVFLGACKPAQSYNILAVPVALTCFPERCYQQNRGEAPKQQRVCLLMG